MHKDEKKSLQAPPTTPIFSLTESVDGASSSRSEEFGSPLTSLLSSEVQEQKHVGGGGGTLLVLPQSTREYPEDLGGLSSSSSKERTRTRPDGASNNNVAKRDPKQLCRAK